MCGPFIYYATHNLTKTTEIGKSLRQAAEEWKVCEQRWLLPVGKLVADGLCIPGLVASTDRQWRAPIVKLQLPSSGAAARFLPKAAQGNFTRGDTVRLQTHHKQNRAANGSKGRGEPHNTLVTISGILCDISSTTALVETDELSLVALEQKLQSAKSKKLVWRMDHGYSTITYERMKATLTRMTHSNPSQALDFIVGSHEKSLHSQLYLQPPEPHVPWNSIPVELNTSQQEAMNTVRESRISLIQGTGCLHHACQERATYETLFLP